MPNATAEDAQRPVHPAAVPQAGTGSTSHPGRARPNTGPDDWFEVTRFAHQMNNLLVTICGLTQLLHDETEDPDIKCDLSTVLGQSRRASDLVRRLLTTYKGRRRGRELVDVESALAKVLADQGPALRMDEVDVETKLGPDLPPVFAVPERLEQVLESILENARISLTEVDKPRRIIVTICHNDGWIEIEFSDRGPGIDPEVLPLVFEPFFTTRGEGRGTGLGLAIARRIVNDCGGEVGISSSRGQGTTVSIRLPAAHRGVESASRWDKLGSYRPSLRSIYRHKGVRRGRCTAWR